MDPHRGASINSNPQRPIDPPLQTVDLGMLENGGLRSSWSPERAEEDKYVPWQLPSLPYEYSESARSRFSNSTTTSIRKTTMWQRIQGYRVGWLSSFEAIIFFSWVNIFILVVPVLWILHFLDMISHVTSFFLSFLSLIPIIKLLDFGAENLALYCGPDIGDLILISLNNAVEAILALWLLANWELRLLQSSIIGVVVLRLLLIPGVSFIVGGARVASQELHPHITGLNHSLLTMGVLAFLLPIAFFTALDRGIFTDDMSATVGIDTGVVSDYMRGEFLKISRGMAVILLAVYICSRVFLHRPPAGEGSLHERSDAPEEMKRLAQELEEAVPTANFSLSIIVSLFSMTLMAITAEILVESIEPMREKFSYSEEWFGLVLLPLVSFSADAVVSIVNFMRNTFFGHNVPHTMASSRHVDDAIQFVMFWAPVLVLLGWVLGRPMSLLFDLFEVAILIGSCFLLNYVTEDSKTNWAEGVMLVALYIMVALSAWFYPQQPEIGMMLSRISIAEVYKETSFGGNEHNIGSSLSSSIMASPPVSTLYGTATTTATTTVSTSQVATPATSPIPTSGLSKELQRLVKLYGVLVDKNTKLQEEIESALSSASSPSRTASAKLPLETKSTSTRQRRRYVQDK
ncbi:hypothetical protein J3R30DRAFT_3709617 [Lentinula aciculospora]|uniref:Sodium/calcium exchanger membrane region domain-containing protein n=1 Tax=Lentinula aciculospora TaxID=153920 RepID=A0A9W9DIH3_9AGAR|nr:hypothetical protein J3R30DRAFT_3709617 [Lentinula aciculospora]